jgi:uncharacterized protein (TIGR02271 family)
MKDIIGFYQTHDQAEHVRDELIAAGFNQGDVKLYERGGQEEPGFWASMKDAFGFADEEDRQLYAEAARRGAVAVGLNYERDDDPRKATEIMSRGAIDLEQQSAQWRQQGWTGQSQYLSPRQQGAAGATAAAGQQQQQPLREGQQQRQVIPVVQEELHVGKREVAAGGVRVHTHVTERPVREQVQLREERVDVERRPVDRPVVAGDEAFKERAVEVTARAEQPVVAKEARVVEEVVVNKDARERTQAVQGTVRRTDVDVQQVPGAAAAGEFREDTFVNELAADQRFRGRDWTTVEPEARKSFESRYPGRTWDQVKESIHRGYDKMRSKV